MVYEVVCTKSYLDVGLCIEKNNKSEPKRVLSRAAYYGSDTEYGGVETVTWVNTGVFLSKEEWKNISYNKGTDQILSELGIEKKIEYGDDNKVNEHFQYIKGCLHDYETVMNGENAKQGWLNEEEEDIVEYFNFHLAKALMKEPYVNAEKIAKFILVAKGLSGDIKVK